MLKKLIAIPFAVAVILGPVGCNKGNDDVPKAAAPENPNLKMTKRGMKAAAPAETEADK